MVKTDYQKTTSIMAKLRGSIIKTNEKYKTKTKIPTRQNVSKGW